MFFKRSRKNYVENQESRQISLFSPPMNLYVMLPLRVLNLHCRNQYRVHKTSDYILTKQIIVNLLEYF
jgi:hypothetical protein